MESSDVEIEVFLSKEVVNVTIIFNVSQSLSEFILLNKCTKSFPFDVMLIATLVPQ